MDQSYAIRIHKDSVSQLEFMTFVENIDGSYIFVEETDANRDHYQGIVKTATKENTLRMRLKRIIKVKGNHSYSMKIVRDYDLYLRYLMKGKGEGSYPEIVARQNILLDFNKIKNLHYEYWNYKNNTKDKSKNLIDFLYDKLKVYESNTKEIVVREIIDYYIVNNKPINTFYIQSQARLLLAKLNDTYKAQLINSICESI